MADTPTGAFRLCFGSFDIHNTMLPINRVCEPVVALVSTNPVAKRSIAQFHVIAHWFRSLIRVRMTCSHSGKGVNANHAFSRHERSSVSAGQVASLSGANPTR